MTTTQLLIQKYGKTEFIVLIAGLAIFGAKQLGYDVSPDQVQSTAAQLETLVDQIHGVKSTHDYSWLAPLVGVGYAWIRGNRKNTKDQLAKG